MSSPFFLVGWSISQLPHVEFRCFVLTSGLIWGKTPAHDRVAYRAGPARLRRRLQPGAVAGGDLARGRAVDVGGRGQPRERRDLLLGAAGAGAGQLRLRLAGPGARPASRGRGARGLGDGHGVSSTVVEPRAPR